MRRSKLFKQTFITLVLLYGVVSTATSIMAAYILSNQMTKEYVSKGRAIAMSIAGASVKTLEEGNLAALQAMIDQYLQISGVAYVYYADEAGRIVSRAAAPSIPSTVWEAYDFEHGDDGLKLPDTHYIDIERPIAAGERGLVHVGMSRDRIRKDIARAVLHQQILLLCIFLIYVAVMYFLVGRIARPLQALTVYAKRLATHDFNAKVDIRSNDEVGLLARTMESMAQELSTLIHSLQLAVENATYELMHNVSFMRAVLDNLADGLLVMDPQGRVLHFNPALLEMYGMGQEDIKNREVRLMFPQDLAELARCAQSLPDRSHMAEITLARGRVGKAVTTSFSSGESSGDEQRSPAGVILLIRDVTAEKEVDRMKTDFISTVSHELRTPLTSVLGFAKIIQRRLSRALLPTLDLSNASVRRAAAQVEQNIAIIVTEGERLTQLINDVLDISKMESGRMEWRLSPVDLKETISRCMESSRPLADAKGLALVADLPDDLPTIQLDKNRIIQVLVNLLSNAIKFTNKGRVRVMAVSRPGEIQVCVEDTGAGVPREDHEKIFERFKQSGDTLTDKPAGTGLGLPICRRIVEAHGGAIWIESEPDHGARLCFTLPLRNPRLRSQERFSMSGAFGAPVLAASAQPHVLVVDDDPSARASLRQIFEDMDMNVSTAQDGFHALEAARRGSFDLITMELAMPGMEGGMCISRLRAMETVRRTPIVVISACSSREVEGANATLPKPVVKEDLVAAVRALLSRTGTGKPYVALTSDGKMNHNNFLIVCAGAPLSCAPADVWTHLNEGFQGTVLIPAAFVKNLDLKRLSSVPGVQVIILPDADRS
ncbi:MAG: ATP-binding protein [Desulfovibrionaceae bacterium]